MNERDRVLDAFRNCITEPKCKDCPWTECETIGHGTIEIPRDLALAVMRELVAQEPRLMTASDFEDNPDVDGSGFLPCWVECNGIEVAQAISLGVIQEGETLDGWTEVSMAELIPTDPSYNPNVRHWTARPSEEQRSATPW